MTIFKYRLPIRGILQLELPEGSEPLTVHEQGSDVRMWVKIPDEHAPKVERIFVVCMTGEDVQISEPYNYIGTFYLDDVTYVGHVFELVR